jgi:hypothetical protein
LGKARSMSCSPRLALPAQEGRLGEVADLQSLHDDLDCHRQGILIRPESGRLVLGVLAARVPAFLSAGLGWESAEPDVTWAVRSRANLAARRRGCPPLGSRCPPGSANSYDASNLMVLALSAEGAGCPFCAQTSPNGLTSLLTNLHRIGTPRRWACVTVAESLRPARVGTLDTVRVSARRRTPADPWSLSPAGPTPAPSLSVLGRSWAPAPQPQ